MLHFLDDYQGAPIIKLFCQIFSVSNSSLALTFDGTLAAKLWFTICTSVVYSLLYSMLLLLTYTKDWLCFQCLCIGLSWMSGVSLSSLCFCSLWTMALLACRVLEWCG